MYGCSREVLHAPELLTTRLVGCRVQASCVVRSARQARHPVKQMVGDGGETHQGWRDRSEVQGALPRRGVALARCRHLLE
jgi:hypothetical protein